MRQGFKTSNPGSSAAPGGALGLVLDRQVAGPRFNYAERRAVSVVVKRDDKSRRM